MTATSTAPEPALRGMIHAGAVPLVLATGVVIVALAPSSGARLALALYAVSATALFSISASYHLSEVGGLARRVLRRLDHAGIFVIIAGTYTPFGLAAAPGTMPSMLLQPIWAGALVSIALHLFWYDAPKWLSAVVYVATGWLGLAALPGLVDQFGWGPPLLLLAGGIFYSLGALVYARRSPDPVPHAFGYHEVFHSLVVVAALAHYVAIAMTLSPGS